MALKRYQETFGSVLADGDIFVLAGASVEVRDETSGALAAIFSDRAGNTAKANPFTADSNGYGFFYADDGRYRITATLSGETVDIRDVLLGVGATTVTTSTGEQSVTEALEQRGPVFDTVADMDAAPDLAVGIKCRTLGYISIGDGGGNDYEIVAAGTGTDDGGSFIDLSGSGHQAKGLFHNRIANARQFGSTGDGSTDDAASLTSWGNSGIKALYIPHGQYLIGSPVTITADNVRVWCDGDITASSALDNAFIFNSNNSDIQLNVDGKDFVGRAVEVNGEDNDVHDCFLRNLKSSTSDAIGVRINYANGGNRVYKNRIATVESVGDGAFGNGNGLARAISITNVTQDATKWSFAYDNICTDIIGEEGDALQTLGLPPSPTEPSERFSVKVIFENNFINTFTRRAFKVQAHDVVIKNNTIRHTVTSPAEIPNIQSVISLVNGSRLRVIGNDIADCRYMSQINVFRANTDSFDFADDVEISKNKIVMGDDDGEFCISVISHGTRHIISDNIIHYSDDRAIVCGNNSQLVISANTFTSDVGSQDLGKEGIRVASTNSFVSVDGNKFLSGNRRCLVQAESNEMAVTNNYYAPQAVLLRDDSAGATGIFVSNNIGRGIVHAGSEIGSESYMCANVTSASNETPAPIYASGPTVLGAINVRKGQIIFNISPAAGGTVGWVAVTSGAANTVTWKTFGNIEA